MLPDARLPELGTRLVRASTLVRTAAGARDGTWPPPGHVCELTGGIAGAVTSVATGLVADAQRTGAIVAWLQPRGGGLYPPDLAANGVDLDALVVVHVPGAPGVPAAPATAAARTEAGDPLPAAGATTRTSRPAPSGPARARGRAPSVPPELPRAAELLLRSGAFDLLVLDLRPMPPRSGAWLGRLQALAREHTARVLLLTDVRAPLAFATGLAQRVEPRRQRAGDAFVVELLLRRDKLHAAAVPAAAPCRGPAGL